MENFIFCEVQESPFTPNWSKYLQLYDKTIQENLVRIYVIFSSLIKLRFLGFPQPGFI